MWEGARLGTRVGSGARAGRVGVVTDGRPQMNKFQHVHLWSHGDPPPCEQTDRQKQLETLPSCRLRIWSVIKSVDYIISHCP